MSAPAIPQGNPLGTESVKKMIWRFAVPGIISQLVNAAHNIVDQIFIGWGIGDLGIAATNIAFPLSIIIVALSVLLGMGAASRFSMLLGSGDTGNAKKAMGNSLTLLVISGCSVAVMIIVFLEPALRLFGATDALMPYARPYALIISTGIPFGVFATGVSFFVRADGNPTFSSLVLLSGALFNIVFDPVFLFAFDMGMAGVALATVLGQLLSALLALMYLLKKLKTVTLSLGDLRLRVETVAGICALGVSPFATHMTSTIFQIVQMNTLRHYGALSAYGSEIPMAVTGAVFKITIILTSCVIGISLGCQPIYGFNFGAKEYGRVKETYILALKYGTVISGAAFLIIQLFPGPIMSVFGSSDPLFYEYGFKYIRIYLFMTFLNAIHPITATYFTATGRAGLSFWLAIIRQGLLLIPLLLILPLLLGLEGFFWAGPISDFIAAAIVAGLARREINRLKALGA